VLHYKFPNYQYNNHLKSRINYGESTGQTFGQSQVVHSIEGIFHPSGKEDINALRSKKPVRVPTVMTREETLKLIGVMHGTHQLMAKLMYGWGLRVMECIRLRVKDIDFAMNQVVVRDGKGKKDRITVLPDGVNQTGP
jgi:integrase